ncbi:hypothetical protein B1B_03716, partial [mine drainage metagenome]
TGLTDPIVDCLWIDPQTPSIILAGTWLEGIYRSTDSGGQWSLVASAPQVTAIIDVGGVIYAPSASGVDSSADSGATWTMYLSTSSQARALVSTGNMLVLGLSNGAIMEQAGSGQPWKTIFTDPSHDVWSLSINQSNPANIYVVEWPGYGAENLYSTQNNGGSWTLFASPAGAQFVALSVGPLPVLYVGVDGGLYSSKDSGVTFTALPLQDCDVRLIEPRANGSVVVGCDQGAYL